MNTAKLHKLFSLLLNLFIISSFFVLPSSVNNIVKAQSALLAMAASHPDQVVTVIVQKMDETTYVEQQVVSLGGRVNSDLPMINAFVAEMSAGAAMDLASNVSVRWISLDAPMYSSSGSGTSIAWATSVGTVITNQFADPTNVVDGSALGPNGLYGYRIGNGKGTFGGFNVEAVPGNAVTKVEAVFYAYANASFSKDYKIRPYINGVAQKDTTVKTTIFSNAIGAQNAGLIFVDITSLKQWQWADFYNNLELYIEHKGFSSSDIIYYDAIGLRITSAPGIDNRLDEWTNPPVVDSVVDGSQQVNVYNQVIGATQLWNTARKLQGKDVTVAVVDSGIYKTEDLSGRIKVNMNFNPSYHDGNDRYGHGTFVAGIIAGSGKKSDGRFIGVAPKANLLNVRIADDQGMVYESDVIKSLQWVHENKDKYKIRVVNTSRDATVRQSYKVSALDAAR